MDTSTVLVVAAKQQMHLEPGQLCPMIHLFPIYLLSKLHFEELIVPSVIVYHWTNAHHLYAYRNGHDLEQLMGLIIPLFSLDPDLLVDPTCMEGIYFCFFFSLERFSLLFAAFWNQNL